MSTKKTTATILLAVALAAVAVARQSNSSTAYSYPQEFSVSGTSELVTNWVTLWKEGVVEHQCGVVTSNYYAMLLWHDTSNRVLLLSSVLLLSTNLTLMQPPQRVFTNNWPYLNQTNWPYYFMQTNWYYTNTWTNIGHLVTVTNN